MMWTGSDIEHAARFCGPYLPDDERTPLTVRDLLPAVFVSAIGTLGLFVFLAGVGCLTGLGCMLAGGRR